jgi:hypothetical protein
VLEPKSKVLTEVVLIQFLLLLFMKSEVSFAERSINFHRVIKLLLADPSVAIEVDSSDYSDEIHFIAHVSVFPQEIFEVCLIDISITPVVNDVKSSFHVESFVTLHVHSKLVKLASEHDFLIEEGCKVVLDN